MKSKLFTIFNRKFPLSISYALLHSNVKIQHKNFTSSGVKSFKANALNISLKEIAQELQMVKVLKFYVILNKFKYAKNKNSIKAGKMQEMII